MNGSAPDPERRRRPADLEPAYRQSLGDRRFIAVSNREPYEHYWDDGSESIAVRRPTGGLVAALDPLMQAVGGVWVAWGSGDRDRAVVDADDRVGVPPEDPSYRLRRLWLDQRDVRQYYAGYANQFLWPLCHLRPALTRTRHRYWERYQEVNRRFAAAALVEAAGQNAAVWFQDYHLATAPRFLREQRRDITTAHFWHIPFPPLEIFRVATHGPDLLRGLIANDLAGFHIPLFCENFLRCVDVMVPGAEVDHSARSVTFEGHTCHVRSFPISMDVTTFRDAASGSAATARVERLRQRYVPNGGMLGVGVDRIDYSKGLEEKLRAITALFEQRPEYRERFTYVQVAVPSRTGIEAYDRLDDSLERAVWSINDRFGTEEWTPVHFRKESLELDALAALYRAADVCMISSLQDGMNLVAKEFVAAQVDDRNGVLLLSKFTGAAQELGGCLGFNPYDTESAADSLHEALQMSPEERASRMTDLQHSLRNIYDWMAELFDVWGAVARGGPVPPSRSDHWTMTP